MNHNSRIPNEMGTSIPARRAAIAFLYHVPEAYEPTTIGQKNFGKTKRGQGLDELSVQCLPIQVRFPGLDK